MSGKQNMFGMFKKASRTDFSTTLDAGGDAAGLHVADIWQRGHTSPSRVSDALLRVRLAEAVTWCDSLGSIDDIRSRALTPRLIHEGPDDLVCDLGLNRQGQLHYLKLLGSCQSPVIAAGRFMVYFPDENLADGYANVVSGGLFDDDNLPACDTWVTFFVDRETSRESARRYLLCYVPISLIGKADAGIEGNPEECIVWLEQSNVSIRQRVEALVASSY